MERPYVLTLIVYERERRALGSLLAPSARGAASRSSRRRRRRRPESLPAQLRPPGSASEPPGTVTAGPGRVGDRDLRGVCVCIYRGVGGRGPCSGGGRAAWGTPASAARCGARGTARPREEQQEEATPLSAWVARAAAASVSPLTPAPHPEEQGEQAAGVGWGWMEKNGGREFRPRGGRDGAAQAEAFALWSRARGGRAAAGGRPRSPPPCPGPPDFSPHPQRVVGKEGRDEDQP